MRWDLRVDALDDFVIEAFHVFGCKRRVKRYHLVEDGSKRPDVRRLVVGLILPDLRGRIVRRACLGLHNAMLGYLRHIEVAELDSTVF